MKSVVIIVLAMMMQPVPGLCQVWEFQADDPIGVASIVLRPATPDESPSMSLTCSRGMPKGRFAIEIVTRIPRAGSGLPRDVTSLDRRIGRDCGPPDTGAVGSREGMVRLRMPAGITTFRADIGVSFIPSEQPVARRLEPPCEIATHSVDPADAVLSLFGLDEDEMSSAAALLAKPGTGEVTVEVEGRPETTRFPLTGAAKALSDAIAFCEGGG